MFSNRHYALKLVITIAALIILSLHAHWVEMGRRLPSITVCKSTPLLCAGRNSGLYGDLLKRESDTFTIENHRGHHKIIGSLPPHITPGASIRILVHHGFKGELTLVRLEEMKQEIGFKWLISILGLLFTLVILWHHFSIQPAALLWWRGNAGQPGALFAYRASRHAEH